MSLVANANVDYRNGNCLLQNRELDYSDDMAEVIHVQYLVCDSVLAPASTSPLACGRYPVMWVVAVVAAPSEAWDDTRINLVGHWPPCTGEQQQSEQHYPFVLENVSNPV